MEQKGLKTLVLTRTMSKHWSLYASF